MNNINNLDEKNRQPLLGYQLRSLVDHSWEYCPKCYSKELILTNVRNADTTWFSGQIHTYRCEHCSLVFDEI